VTGIDAGRRDVPDDCTACGACCFSNRGDYIAVFAVDEARMDQVARALTRVTDGRRFMRFAHGRCAALSVGGERLVCSIYPMRPDACRWLERGGSECRAQFARKGQRALVALRRSDGSSQAGTASAGTSGADRSGLGD